MNSDSFLPQMTPPADSARPPGYARTESFEKVSIQALILCLLQYFWLALDGGAR